MKWKYKKLGHHIHVSVYTDEILNGKLIFNEDEFSWIKAEMCGHITFEQLPKWNGENI